MAKQILLQEGETIPSTRRTAVVSKSEKSGIKMNESSPGGCINVRCDTSSLRDVLAILAAKPLNYIYFVGFEQSEITQ